MGKDSGIKRLMTAAKQTNYLRSHSRATGQSEWLESLALPVSDESPGYLEARLISLKRATVFSCLGGLPHS